ncbi:glutamyl-tRNA reductase [Steroidobacter agaridevorans]|uniref:Glutamyl-tRNA reductase n=1 Tax=Steroidobacter agaridevorans TaxID=2695856 RepID=A0A829YA98_9GAMM|nr:glutamyl-tRNA reductase [Steroidobacter agaridevorans]GFE79562.1 glutamyl-tRNA reductase [Steroidobacter agaridevorans]GFE88567.1 glutamyl-tRNA reductase [Steroidobacter agaridevorans]
MPLVVIGINHRTAPVEIREKMVFAGEELPAALRELAGQPGVREALIVSTCNRTELYCFADAGGESPDGVINEPALLPDPSLPLSDWLAHWHDLAAHRLDLNQTLYRLHGSAAVQHLFAVACGLDSLVIGEPQILGQLKDAYRAAHEQKVTGPYLNRVMQTAFSVAKRVRTQTRIGANAVSVAYAAVSLARTVFEKFAGHTALLVGAGETIALAARHLHANGLGRMIVANRSIGRAQELAAEFKGFAIGIDDIAAHLPEADIVITSTASPTPVITYDAVQAAVRARKRKPIFMVDIAVPRDIEAEVSKIEDVYLFTIDDLQNVVNENLASRREAARDASEMLATEVSLFEQQLKTLDAVPMIRQLRQDAEEVRSQTAAQARRMLAAGRDPKDVVDFLSSTLTNRLLHGPSQRLREAAEQGEVELLEAARILFAADAPDQT